MSRLRRCHELRRPPRRPRRAARRHRPPASSGPRSEVIRSYQRTSEVIRGHQRPSEAIRGHQRPSEAIRGRQRSSEVVRGHQTPTKAIKGHQRPSETLRGHQRHSEAISSTHLHRIPLIPACRAQEATHPNRRELAKEGGRVLVQVQAAPILAKGHTQHHEGGAVALVAWDPGRALTHIQPLAAPFHPHRRAFLGT
jgi:hypothetical protein